MPRPRMTKRRLEVLRLTARGYTTEETAEIMGIAFDTVKNTLSASRKILKACNTVQAVVICLKYGYFHLRDL